MKSLFIARVAELLKTGESSPAVIYDIIQPEYAKKGSVVTYNNVVSAMACVNNGWYTGETKGETPDDSDSV